MFGEVLRDALQISHLGLIDHCYHQEHVQTDTIIAQGFCMCICMSTSCLTTDVTKAVRKLLNVVYYICSTITSSNTQICVHYGSSFTMRKQLAAHHSYSVFGGV